MAKHTLKEILGIFAAHIGHTHEAAVQATYDAGHAAGRDEVKAEFAAGLASPPPPAPAEGETSDEEHEAADGQASAGQAGTGSASKDAQGAQVPAA